MVVKERGKREGKEKVARKQKLPHPHFIPCISEISPLWQTVQGFPRFRWMSTRFV